MAGTFRERKPLAIQTLLQQRSNLNPSTEAILRRIQRSSCETRKGMQDKLIRIAADSDRDSDLANLINVPVTQSAFQWRAWKIMLSKLQHSDQMEDI